LEARLQEVEQFADTAIEGSEEAALELSNAKNKQQLSIPNAKSSLEQTIKVCET
jgi:hypothetical protein